MELESRPFISNKGRNAVVIGMQIKSHLDGHVLGAIILAISDEYLSKALYPPKDITGSDLIVFDPAGQVITVTADELASMPELKSLDSNEPFLGLQNFNKSQYLISQLYTTPLNWRVVLLTDYRSFTAPLAKEYYGSIALTIILLFVLLISVILVTNSVNTPINQLIKAMRDTSRENRFPLVKVTGSDEMTYLGTTFNEMSQRIQQLIREIHEVNDKKRAAELLALQSQINPHLLYNSLDSINWIAYTTGNKDICGIIAALSDFYRLTLDKGHTTHTIRSELKQIESYLRLQSMNYHHKIAYSVDGQDDCMDCLVPKVILQPIVENALTHGFSETELTVLIRVYKQHDHLIIEVSDNGPGIGNYDASNLFPEPSYGENCHGYGLYNINERIKLFFGEEYGITLHPNHPKGLLVRFTLSFHPISDKRGNILC
jgi:two-component system sensor histidine kinase YesM